MGHGFSLFSSEADFFALSIGKALVWCLHTDMVSVALDSGNRHEKRVALNILRDDSKERFPSFLNNANEVGYFYIDSLYKNFDNFT